MQDTIPAAQVTDLLAAIRDALQMPDGGRQRDRDQLLGMRAAFLRGVLRTSAEGNLGDITATTHTVRQTAELFPARYPTPRDGER